MGIRGWVLSAAAYGAAVGRLDNDRTSGQDCGTMKPDHSILSDLALTSAADKAVARSHGLIVRTRRQMMATHEIIEESRRALERSMAILSQGQVVRGK